MNKIIDVGVALVSENTRLRAEVERLRAELKAALDAVTEVSAGRFLAEARLAKVVSAGDALAHRASVSADLDPEIEMWRAATQPEEEK